MAKVKQQGLTPGESRRGLNRAPDQSGAGVKVRDWEDPMKTKVDRSANLGKYLHKSKAK